MNQNRQPAGVPTGGQFAASARAEATVGLAASPAPITAHDIDVLREHKGAFKEGYTPEDAARVLSKFDSAHMTVFWDSVDSNGGLYGDSFFAGVPSSSDPMAPAWDHHMMDDRVWSYLCDEDSTEDPGSFTSLLKPQPARINGGELYTYHVGDHVQHAFYADYDEDYDDEEY